ncbi:MAG: hypothetical protein FD167_2692 [bacterium]|nr:MAG: hypothetical protein FD167_2692 [bacterium]
MENQIEIDEKEFKRLLKLGAITVKDIHGQEFVIVGNKTFKKSASKHDKEENTSII